MFVRFSKKGKTLTWFEQVEGQHYRCLWSKGQAWQEDSDHNRLLSKEDASNPEVLLREDFDECPDELAVLLMTAALLS